MALGARLLFGALLRREPRLEITAAKQEAFAAKAAEVLAANGATVPWDLPWPRHEFTRYLVRDYPVLLHGTPRADVDRLEPAEQTLFDGRRVTAVFATDDGIWPLFFATLDRSKHAGPYSLRNAAMVVGKPGRERRYYLFSMSRELHRSGVFGPGVVLVLPRDPFAPAGTGVVRWPEWVSAQPVRPLARLDVAPDEFPFRRRIAVHRDREWFPLTWLLYRWRTRRA